jgi:hypothetical protein
MSTDDNGRRTEYTDAGYPIEIYSDKRIEEFLAEDKITPEERKRIDEKGAQMKIRKP